MDSLISTFHIDIKLLIAQIINFGIVFIVLYVFAIKPLAKTMTDRSKKIEKGIKDAKNNAEQLEKTNQEYKQMIAKGRSEAHELIKKANLDSEIKRHEIITKAKEEVSSIVLEGKAQLSAQKIEMIKEAKAEIIDIIAKATKKVLSGAVTTEIDNELINKSIKEIKNE